MKYNHPLIEVSNARANTKRYRVTSGSETGHCCYMATVVDTKADNSSYEQYVVCECFSVEAALRIAKTLNKHDYIQIIPKQDK